VLLPCRCATKGVWEPSEGKGEGGASAKVSLDAVAKEVELNSLIIYNL